MALGEWPTPVAGGNHDPIAKVFLVANAHYRYALLPGSMGNGGGTPKLDSIFIFMSSCRWIPEAELSLAPNHGQSEKRSAQLDPHLQLALQKQPGTSPAG